MTITPTLDDCSRSDETPVSNGGVWTVPALNGDFNAALLLNVLRSGGAGWGSAYINSFVARDLEVWATVSASAAPNNLLFYRITSPNTSQTKLMVADFQPTPDLCVWQYWISATAQWTHNISMTINANDKCSVRAVGNTHYFFVNDVLRATRTFDDQQVPGYIGFRGWQTASQGWANYGGGQMSTLDPLDTSLYPRQQLESFAVLG